MTHNSKGTEPTLDDDLDDDDLSPAQDPKDYCTKHRLKHGQKYKSCTPQKLTNSMSDAVQHELGKAQNKASEDSGWKKQKWTRKFGFEDKVPEDKPGTYIVAPEGTAKADDRYHKRFINYVPSESLTDKEHQVIQEGFDKLYPADSTELEEIVNIILAPNGDAYSKAEIIFALITQKETEARVDELKEIQTHPDLTDEVKDLFYEIYISKRIATLKTQQEKTDD